MTDQKIKGIQFVTGADLEVNHGRGLKASVQPGGAAVPSDPEPEPELVILPEEEPEIEVIEIEEDADE
jgi:hypothetical protein